MKVSPRARRVLFALAAMMSVFGIWQVAQSFKADTIYRKDFLQEYALARAVRLGLAPYAPLSELIPRVTDAPPLPLFHHPTPHPPVLALLVTPLAWLTYQQAALLWLMLELTCLFIALRALQRWQCNEPAARRTFMLAALALGWPAVWDGLAHGQLSLVLCCLITLGWLAWRAGKLTQAGALLGLSLSIKLFGLPLLLWWSLRRQWQAVCAALATVLSLHALAALTLGSQTIWTYYTQVSRQVLPFYRGDSNNLSIGSLGWRIFAGLDSPSALSLYGAPVFLADKTLAEISFAVFPIAFVLIGFWLAWRSSSEDEAFAVLLITSVIVSPVMWAHYLVIALPAFVILARSLWQTNALPAAVIALCLITPRQTLARLAQLFNLGLQEDGALMLSPLGSLVTFLPTFALCLLLWLHWRNQRARQANS